MKKFGLLIIIAATFCLLLANGTFGKEKAPLKKATGEVMAIDEGGKAIAIKCKIDKKEFIVGTIIDQNTKIKAKRKTVSLKEIKPKDRVTIIYAYEKNDLYAKEIIKK
jgi:hypothetical protein